MSILAQKWLSVAQVAEVFGVSRYTVARMCREGRMEGAVRVGKLWRIPENTVVTRMTAPARKEPVNPFMTADSR